MAEDSKVFGALAYLFGLLSGIVIYLWQKDDGYARFHAMQSILLSIAYVVVMVAILILGMVTMGFGLLLMFPFYLVAAGVWIYGMYKAFMGEKIMLPVIGEMAKKYAA